MTVPAVAIGASAVTTSCSSSADEPDQLLGLAKAAKSDAALAEATAAAHSDLAASASEVAEARQAHARALRREIERVNPPDPEQGPTVPDVPRPEVSQSAEAAIGELREALESARGKAAQLVAGTPPHRAGLTGSILASCASLLEVLP